MRHQLRADGDLKHYFADFREYLGTQASLLDQLAKSLTGCVALLCFERNPAGVPSLGCCRRARQTS